MKIQIFLENDETQEMAEADLVKAITEKYVPESHPDPVVEELTQKLKGAYNKELLKMMDEIFEVIKYRENEK
jgi:hypothetical protein